MSKKQTTPKVPKTWYYVTEDNDITDNCLDNVVTTLGQAYAEEIECNGDGKKYAYKIERLGRIEQTLKIVKE